MNKQTLNFVGVLGLVIVLFGLLAAAVEGSLFRDQWALIPIHLALGGVLLVGFVLLGGLRSINLRSLKRASRFGAALSVHSFLFVGLLVVANMLAAKYRLFYFDSTEQGVYSLAPQTEALLKQLDGDLTIRAFYLEGFVDPQVEILLDLLASRSSRVHWQAFDPEKQPQLVSELQIEPPATLHLSYKTASGTRSGRLVGRSIDEQSLDNAIRKLLEGQARVVYFLQGNGEGNLQNESAAGYSRLKAALEGENLLIRELRPTRGAPIPDDAAALLIVAPQKSYLKEDYQALGQYLARGGSLLLLSEFNTPNVFRPLLEQLGIFVGDDIIVDKTARVVSAGSLGVQPVVSKFDQWHPITRGLDIDVALSTVRSVHAGSENAPAKEIAFTDRETWAEKDIALLMGDEPQAALEDGDTPGPVPVAVAFEGAVTARIVDDADAAHDSPAIDPAAETSAEKAETTKKASRVVVIGDADFAANVNISLLANRDFVLNVVNWLLGSEESISIRPRTLRSASTPVDERQFSALFAISVLIVPELILAIGLWVWCARRRSAEVLA